MSQQDVMMAELQGGMYGPNLYSQFQGRIPQPGYSGGTPTDAMGNPIQPPPGTTLNSTPAAAPQAAPAAQTIAPKYGDWSSLAPTISSDPTLQANYARNLGLGPMGAYVPSSQTANAAPQAAAPQQAASGGSLDDAISLLSNPGKVNTPGATVPQYQIGNQPSVLQQFLANQKGGTGAGNYSNTGFFDTLNALGGQKGQ
jgi:hypothetical protein